MCHFKGTNLQNHCQNFLVDIFCHVFLSMFRAYIEENLVLELKLPNLLGYVHVTK